MLDEVVASEEGAELERRQFGHPYMRVSPRPLKIIFIGVC